jgi:choline dehydrogenase
VSDGPRFDYIVVGAGAAGCVLADRLTAPGRHRVLILEAGGTDKKLWIRIPAGFTRTIFDRSVGWAYTYDPADATGGRDIPCPRGRVLGGSSSINGHLYVRGQREDYDGWAASGATGWSWADVLPYFIRAERRRGGDRAVRGRDGPLHVTDPDMRHRLCERFLAALRAQGVPDNTDYNSGDQAGCGYYQYLIRHGRRWSASDAYLRPAIERPNLSVRVEAQVTKILFDGRRAVGVECRYGDRLATFRADREVILSAGAINTPQLLQLSGIGDPELLRRHGIAPLHASPHVGEGLADHYAVRIAARVRGIASLNERAHGARLVLEVAKYALARRGLLASAVAHAYGFVRSTPDAARPDLQLLFTPASYERGRVGQAGIERLPGLTCGVTQLRPASRGYVRIASADPLTPPVIQPRFLAEEADRLALLRGVRFVRRVFSTSPLADCLETETWPGTACDDDEAILEFIRSTGSTVYHPVGSCRMGADTDAPVAPDLRVRGVDGLRVVDASVMPAMVSGNTYAATIMIAEKGSDAILGTG